MVKYDDKKMNKKQYSRTLNIAKEYLLAVRKDPNEINSDEEIFESIGKKLSIETRFVRSIINNRSEAIEVPANSKKPSGEKFSITEILKIRAKLADEYGEKSRMASKTNALREYSKANGLYWSENQIRGKRNAISWV